MVVAMSGPPPASEGSGVADASGEPSGELIGGTLESPLAGGPLAPSVVPEGVVAGCEPGAVVPVPPPQAAATREIAASPANSR